MDNTDLNLEPTSKKRKLSRSESSSQGVTRKHTRVLAACDECRISKTRCDSARPVCAKCLKKGVPCVYPDKDPFSMYVTSSPNGNVEKVLFCTDTFEKDLNRGVNVYLEPLRASRRFSLN